MSNMQVVELHLLLLIGSLVGDEPAVGLVLTADEGFASLLRMARKMCHLRLEDSPETLDAALAWLKAAEECQKKRNRIAHATWVAEEEGGELREELVITANKGRLVTETRSLTTDDVGAASAQMYEAIQQFDRSLRPALAKTHPEVDRRIAGATLR